MGSWHNADQTVFDGGKKQFDHSDFNSNNQVWSIGPKISASF